MTDRFGPDVFGGDYAKSDPESRSMSDLWRAVIAQAIRDLDSAETDAKLDAALWFGAPATAFAPSILVEDYVEVCDLAHIDAKTLQTIVFGIMQLQNPYRRLRLTKLADHVNRVGRQLAESQAPLLKAA